MQIRRVMTAAPQTIGSTRSVAEARAMMSELNVRHLPVLTGGRLAGILSDRDVALIESLKDVSADSVKVNEAMTEEVLEVRPEQSIQRVASEMARRKCGSALVVKNGKLLGIFTTVDALEVLARPVEPRAGKKVVAERVVAKKKQKPAVTRRAKRS